MAAPAPKRAKLEDLSVDANEALTFRLLRPGGADLGSASDFKPEMCHQLFGDDEAIKGHQDPEATVLMSHMTFEHSITFHSASQQPGATQVEEILKEHLAEGLLASNDSLLKAHASATGLDAAALGSPLLRSTSGADSIYRFDLADAPAAVKALHARVQQLLVFFVDGATPLDQSEPDWDLLIAVRRVEGQLVMVGFCTVYRLYAYPNSARLRISQILVLPPFMKQGVGRLLMEAVFKLADDQSVQDVLVEDPTEEVQALRERIELRRALQLPWLVKLAGERDAGSVAMNGSAGAQPPSSLALDPDTAARAQRELRIPKQEVRRVWEALLSQQAAFKKEPGVHVLRGLVARRLFGSFADTKRQAVGKQIFTFDDAGSFCMCKVPQAEGIKGMPVALEDNAEGGQSAEEREEALEEAVEQRMQYLFSQAVQSQA